MGIGGLRLVVSPIVYIQLRDEASAIGRTLPPFWGAYLADVIKGLLAGAEFIAPWVVYKSQAIMPTTEQIGSVE